ncbi:MAG TPA: hypothetical protein HPQ04_12225, partial [Rhodospirillaceae bacterium]|nr:hypothetical protein [Rhodospirillaceae bacterium]
MTASATSGRAQGALLLCLALALAGAGAPALGQNGPTSLLPGAGSAPPTPVPPVMPPSTSPSTPPSMPGGPSGDRIQVQDLGAPDPSAVGLLDSGHGGFPAELWAGSSIATIRKAVTLLPAPQPWRSLLQLERRLLLSIAQVPPAPAGEEPLVKLRADRLWALGDLDDLTALLKVIPSPATTPALRRLQAETALLLGDNGTACDQAAALRTTAGDDPFAAKLQVYCLFAGGKGREAGLGVDLLRDQKVNDPPFFAAADTLAGIGAGHLDSRTAPSPLVLAMARLAKLPAAETTGPADPPQLRAMAGWPGDAQLAQAERAEAIGALKTEALREIYQQAVFSPAE